MVSFWNRELASGESVPGAIIVACRFGKGSDVPFRRRMRVSLIQPIESNAQVWHEALAMSAGTTGLCQGEERVMGLKIARVRGRSMEPGLPHGTIALFRTSIRPKKDDLVLVEHPDLGKVARKVRAIGRKGNVHLKAI